MISSLLSGVLFATQVAAPAPTPAPAATDPLQRKVCWRDQATGTIMPPERICMTVAERRAWLARMQGNVNALLNRTQRAAPDPAK